MAPDGDHVPGAAVSLTPTWGLPVTVGRAVFLMVGLPRWMKALGHLLLVVEMVRWL